VSVERILEYCRLPSEAALDSAPGRAPRPSWPEKGAIEARDLQVAYRPGLPLVLKGLSFRIEGGMRVGIVGRTGGWARTGG
jgi:ATP-binding cassette, subfamily C (CFTR/MRP), member 1